MTTTGLHPCAAWPALTLLMGSSVVPGEMGGCAVCLIPSEGVSAPLRILRVLEVIVVQSLPCHLWQFCSPGLLAWHVESSRAWEV